MARTLYPAQVAMNLSEAKWSLADDNAQDESKPVAGDTGITTANSGTLTLDEVTAGLAALTVGGAEWATSTFTTTTVTLSQTAGTISGSGDFDVGGNISIAGGTMSNTGTWTQTDTGDIINASTARIFTALVLAASTKTSTLTGIVYTKKLALAGGTLALGTNGLIVRLPTGNDFWTDTGMETYTFGAGGGVTFEAFASRNQKAMCIHAPVTFSGNNAATLTATGVWDFTAQPVIIRANGPWISTVAMGANALTAGATALGRAGLAARLGGLDLGSGTHSIASLARAEAGDAANELAFGTSATALSGAIDGTGIVATNTLGSVVGGDIDNLDLTAQTPLLHIYPNSAGGGNTNVTEVNGLGLVAPYVYAAA